MLYIIKIDNYPHNIQAQSGREECWEDGYIEIPNDLIRVAVDSFGYCDLKIEDGKLVDIVKNEIPKVPSAPPTEIEILRADVDYLLIMNGVTE